MGLQLLDVVALDDRAQLLGADAETLGLDVVRDRVLTLWCKACGSVLGVRLAEENNK
jgi:hypothetical protein